MRLGSGNLKSLVVFLVMGLFAYMTLRGLIAPARVSLEGATDLDLTRAGLTGQGLPALLAAATGIQAGTARAGLAILASGGLALWCFKDAAFRAARAEVTAGLVLGALVPVGWAITGLLGHDEFEPVALASFTFVGPIGESLQYLMTFTGATITFGIAAVGGVIAGSCLASLASGGWRIEAFADASDLLRHLLGAALMGVGGVMSLGCTIGQGLTGLSTLAAGSVMALAAIVAGGVLGIKSLEHGSLAGALKAALARG